MEWAYNRKLVLIVYRIFSTSLGKFDLRLKFVIVRSIILVAVSQARRLGYEFKAEESCLIKRIFQKVSFFKA